MSRFRGLVVLALLGTPAAWAASPVGTPVLRIERIDVSAPPRIRLFVTQVGQDGQVRPPPAPASVKLMVDGQALVTPELRVGTAKSVGDPLAVTFVLQDSGGMDAAFPEALRSLLEIGDALPAGSSVGVVAFTNTVRTALDPQPFMQVKDELSRITIDNDAIETQLGIGVLRGLEGLTGPKAVALPQRRVLLVVAEGLTASYERTEFTALASRAKDNGVRIHAIGYYKFGEPEQPTLALLSSLSKGTLRAYTDPAGVREGLKAAGAELSDQWVLDIEQPRLFDGLRHDFQLELSGGQASEVERAIVPASEVGKSKDLGPALYGAGIVLVLVVIGVGVALWSKKRKAEAQQVMAGLQPRGIPAANTAINVNPRQAPPAANTAPSAIPPYNSTPAPPPKPLLPPADETPIRDRPVPVLSGDDDALKVRTPIAPAITNEADLMALPSPTQFLRRLDMAGVKDEGPPRQPTLPPPVLPSVPKPKSLPPDEDTSPQADIEMLSRPALWATIDDVAVQPTSPSPEILAPSPQLLNATLPPVKGALRSARNARLESGAMMLKTQVLMPSEGTRSEAVAWLARLAPPTMTIPLSNGHKVGKWVFSVDMLGRWVLKNGDTMKVLADAEILDLDGEAYVMKLATKVRPAPSTKDGLMLIVGGPDDGRVVSVARGEARVVGAHPRADVRVRGKQIAPYHLGVTVEGGRLHVADLGTTEGFKIGGEQVWRAALTPGQEILLGTVRLVFQRA